MHIVLKDTSQPDAMYDYWLAPRSKNTNKQNVIKNIFVIIELILI